MHGLCTVVDQTLFYRSKCHLKSICTGFLILKLREMERKSKRIDRINLQSDTGICSLNPSAPRAMTSRLPLPMSDT